jgi:hypothetical protein
MFNPWFALSLKTVRMGMEAQSVIALRMLRMGWWRARRGRSRPYGVSEVVAAGEAQVAVAGATLLGHKKHVVAGKVLNTIENGQGRIGVGSGADSCVMRASLWGWPGDSSRGKN